MDISIIIISYNENEYLEMSLGSCLCQTNIDSFEIIIGDDGSNDGSLNTIKKYTSKYPKKIKYFVMDRDKKEIIPSLRVSDVIRRALKIASGKYITILSADDYYLNETKLYQQYDFLEKNCNYFSCFINYSIDNGISVQRNHTLRYPSLRKLFWSRYYVHASCFMFRNINFENRLNRFCDDIGLIYSLFLLGRTKYINDNSFAYRQRIDSIMHKQDIVEKNINELISLQDCLNRKKYFFSTLSRYRNSLMFLFNNRKKLNNNKYEKYMKLCSSEKNNILWLISNYDKNNLFKKLLMFSLLVISSFSRLFYKVVDKLYMLLINKLMIE